MGGAEVTYLNLKHPELMIRGIVDTSIVLNGAIGGSELALQLKDNLLASSLKKFLGKGLESLTPPKAHSNFKKAYEEFNDQLSQTLGTERAQDEVENLSRRLFYVTSCKPTEDPLSLGLRIVLSFLKNSLDNGAGQCQDGLLYIQDQLLVDEGNLTPLFGTHLISPELGSLSTLSADHIELVVSGAFAKSNSKKRTAFTHALLRTVFELSR
jgi:hypothetical protein